LWESSGTLGPNSADHPVSEKRKSWGGRAKPRSPDGRVPMGLLAGIESPDALRKLSRPELHTVANELRAELIRVGSEVGGHFAGSLGTVELTVALHYLLDTPRDRVVWDVGHQAYGHKALTGRRAGLMKIKKADGPSGFLRRAERGH